MTDSAALQMAQFAVDTAYEAGKRILQYYGTGIEIQLKADRSPLTEADKVSHTLIATRLAETGLPVVSEENDEPIVIAAGQSYWLVDPLDGTKDFLAGNDEFTVNIALVKMDRPVVGVVYGPATGEMYAGVIGAGSWMEHKGARHQAQQRGPAAELTMATSRFHDSPDAHHFATLNGITQWEAVGSSLKYGRMIFGEIDVYPRLVGTSEWDTAAGQAVLEAAGGQLLAWDSGSSMTYNKPNRRNGRFIAMRSPYNYESFKYPVFDNEIS